MLTPATKKNRLLVVLLAGLPFFSGCTALEAGRDLVTGLAETILGDDDSSDPPAELTEYQAELKIDILWKESVGGGADKQLLKLIPAIRNDRIYAADHNGRLQAHNTADGNLIWEADSELPYSAGPGLGSNVVVMGCTSGEVAGFDIVNGERKWITAVPSEVQAVPVIAKGTVIVRTTDGKVVALREADGSQLWVSESSVPALSVRGASTPLIVNDTVFIGSANGKLQALQLRDGKNLWETTIAMPSGRSEIERLVDLDVDPTDNRGAIFIASFTGGTSAAAEVDGDVIWRNPEVSSYAGISSDFRYLYVTDTQSEVLQLDQRSGTALWKQKSLHNRRLTAPIVYGNYVVAGDYQGYVHWLSTHDGRLLARTQVSDSPIEAKPVVEGGIVYIYAKDGTLAALKAK
ncbi:MAG: outer membrane protein assembly factor BamB [Gammaproteobacteria bacterium]